MEQAPTSEPAGFRRRALALLIDWAICAGFVAVCAVALFAATNGRWQFIPDAVPRWCQGIDPVPSGLPLPPGFAPNQAKLCDYTLLGWSAARTLTLTESTAEGYVTNNRSLVWTVDADGMAWGGDILGGPVEELLVLFRLLCDRLARSPGRRVCGIAVVEDLMGRRAPFSRLWRRYLLFSIPIGIGYLAWIPGLLEPPSLNVSGFHLGIALLAMLLSLALLFWSVVSINARRPTYYDRPVGTSVSRE